MRIRLFLLFLLSCMPAIGFTQTPLVNAHAHNDYEHKRPLLDALEHGFCSVEADIYLVGGELLVAHYRNGVRPGRTLQSLYLDPLRKRVQENGGKVYKNGPEFQLLIDVKSDAETTYAALRDVLKQYADILTEFHPKATKHRAVTAILSGARAFKTIAAEQVRLVGIDGRLSDLDSDINPHLMPLISDQWSGRFRWLGVGEMPADERQKLEAIVKKTRKAGVRLRFWATPESPALWRTLREIGVDLLNADDLGKLQQFLLTPRTP